MDGWRYIAGMLWTSRAPRRSFRTRAERVAAERLLVCLDPTTAPDSIRRTYWRRLKAVAVTCLA